MTKFGINIVDAEANIMEKAGMPRVGRDIMAFVGSCLSTWQAYLTGGAVQAVVNIYERQRGYAILWDTYRWGVFAFLIAAFFVIWRTERHKAELLEATKAPDLTALYETTTRQENTIATQRGEIDRLASMLKSLAETEPRTLAEDDHARIVMTVKRLTFGDQTPQAYPLRQLTVLAVPGVHDSKSYAELLSAAFRAGGIHCPWNQQSLHPVDSDQYRKGITLKGLDSKQPNTRDIVRAALAKASIAVRIDNSGINDGVQLIIGGRDLEGTVEQLAENVRKLEPRKLERLQLFRSMEELSKRAGTALLQHNIRICPVPTVHDSATLAAQLREGFEHVGSHAVIDESGPQAEYWTAYVLREFGIWVDGNSGRDLEGWIAATLRGLGMVASLGDLVAPDKYPPYNGFEIWVVVGNDGESAVTPKLAPVS